ncbi:hypothetical protein BT69DRAFT_985245 [Atractiella rhizophila]|nr:hypothetical protein BT69DRAFT_985245 [Atractiella rhizophila]
MLQPTAPAELPDTPPEVGQNPNNPYIPFVEGISTPDPTPYVPPEPGEFVPFWRKENWTVERYAYANRDANKQPPIVKAGGVSISFRKKAKRGNSEPHGNNGASSSSAS